jgi:carboxyl-terminal processing protease
MVRSVSTALRFLPALLLGLAASGAPAAAAELTCAAVPNLIRTLLSHHIRTRELGDAVKTKAIDSYLARLDPSKTLFLESEAAALRGQLAPVFDELGKSDCSRLEAVKQVVVGRFQATEDSVRTFVTREDYAVDPEVTLVLDPELRGRPRTEEEREATNRSFVHFQVSNYLSAGIELPEAKQRLVHRYELMTRRAKEQTPEDVYGAFLDAFASSLDPHTNYFSRDALEDFQIGVSLSLEGIGVALSSQDGYSVVEKVIPGGATDRAGVLKENDKIIAVAQQGEPPVDIIDMALRDVVRLIRGKRGTEVTLTVLRQEDETSRFQVTIVRDQIDLEEQAAKLRFEERKVGDTAVKLAVLDLPSFYGDKDPTKRQCAADVARLLQQARREKADGLVLDLSRNGGGILDFAVRISGFFLKDGGVVAVQDAKAETQVLDDPDEGILWDGPLVVLTSRLSASGSEIVAGALRDYQRALIVGDDHTFGKGTVQSIINLPPGLGALKVTTALFFRPGGESTQHDGVDAHIVIPSPYATESFGERTQPYSLAGSTIDGFLPAATRGADDGPGFATVSDELVAVLSSRSQTRVGGSEDFARIRDQIEKAKANEGRVRLSEILKEREANGTPGTDVEGAAPEAKASDTEPTPQLREAVDILADYVAWTRAPASLTTAQTAPDATPLPQ